MRLFPELDRFPTRRARKKAWRRARDQSWNRPAGFVYVACLLFLLLAAAVVAIRFYIRPHFGAVWVDRSKHIVLYSLLFGYPSLVAVMLRRRIRSGLRRELVQSGVPTCLSCGYDLTGNESGVCPECGTRASDNQP